MSAFVECLAFSGYLKSRCRSRANFGAAPFNRAALSSYVAIAIYIPGLFGGLRARAVINDVPGLGPGKFYGHDRCN